MTACFEKFFVGQSWCSSTADERDRLSLCQISDLLVLFQKASAECSFGQCSDFSLMRGDRSE